jgi:arylsulfatase A-like enzyme
MSRNVKVRIGIVAALAAALVLSPQVHNPSASALPVFSDDFSSGTLANWTGATNVSIDSSVWRTAPPSARAQAASSPAFAYKVLPTTLGTICMRAAVNVVSGAAGPVSLLLLRTANNGAVVRAYIGSDGVLSIKSDVTGVQKWSGTALGSGWHTIELCGTVGTATAWDLYRDDVRIVANWTANSGTTPVGRVDIGDNGAKTFTINFDDVVVTQTHSTEVDPPTAPGKPVGSSPAAGSITITWAASQDASPPITYRIYRDGNPTAIGSVTTTSFTDGGLTPGSTHTYAVDAVDSLGNPPSPKSPPSDPITVSSTMSTIFSDDFSSGGFSTWTGVTRLTIDTTRGGTAPPSARAQVTSQSAFAYKNLPTTLPTLCVTSSVNATSLDPSSVTLLRLRTAANGPVVRVYATSAGVLALRSDVSATTRSSGVSLGTGWHTLRICGTVGTSGSWDLYRDGVKIVTAWVANTGTAPVGRVEVGDTAAKTFTMNVDDVSVTGQGGSQQSAPNILIFLTDDQRATDTVIPSVMPKLRQWLAAGGREYTNFFGATPLCCPDRAVIFSGRYAHNTGVRTNPDGANLDHARTMERLLEQRGYDSAYVGKFLNDWPVSNKPPYFRRYSLTGGGYSGQFWNIDGVGRTYPDYTTDLIGQRSVAYLDQFEANDAQPWFMFVATPAPHYPWEPAAKYATADVGTWTGNPATAESDRSDKPPWVQARNKSLAEAQAVRTPQLRTLMSVDDMVGTVMTRVQQLGELANTLVMYTSDNGYVWGEHHLGGDYGTAGQKRYPYTESAKLPFLIRWDGHVQPGTTDTRLTSTVDIVPTVLQAAGVTADYPLDGHSLTSTFTRSRLLLEYWLDPGDASIPTWISLRTPTVQFVEYYDANGNVTFREYYDLQNDPWELVNLLNDGNPANPNITQLVSQVRADALCVGTSETSPMPAVPCP